MGMGIVSNDDFDKELGDIAGIKPVNEKVVNINHGRGKEVLNVPMEIRKLVSSEAICGVTSRELSETFGISQPSVNAYKNGATSLATYHKPNEELKKHNDAVRNNIIGKAQSKLLEAIDHISTDKLRDAKLTEISTVTKDMSAIVKNMTPDNVNALINNQQVIVYKPRMMPDEEFEVIAVNE